MLRHRQEGTLLLPYPRLQNNSFQHIGVIVEKLGEDTPDCARNKQLYLYSPTIVRQSGRLICSQDWKELNLGDWVEFTTYGKEMYNVSKKRTAAPFYTKIDKGRVTLNVQFFLLPEPPFKNTSFRGLSKMWSPEIGPCFVSRKAIEILNMRWEKMYKGWLTWDEYKNFATRFTNDDDIMPPEPHCYWRLDSPTVIGYELEVMSDDAYHREMRRLQDKAQDSWDMAAKMEVQRYEGTEDRDIVTPLERSTFARFDTIQPLKKSSLATQLDKFSFTSSSTTPFVDMPTPAPSLSRATTPAQGFVLIDPVRLKGEVLPIESTGPVSSSQNGFNASSTARTSIQNSQANSERSNFATHSQRPADALPFGASLNASGSIFVQPRLGFNNIPNRSNDDGWTRPLDKTSFNPRAANNRNDSSSTSRGRFLVPKSKSTCTNNIPNRRYDNGPSKSLTNNNCTSRTPANNQNNPSSTYNASSIGSKISYKTMPQAFTPIQQHKETPVNTQQSLKVSCLDSRDAKCSDAGKGVLPHSAQKSNSSWSVSSSCSYGSSSSGVPRTQNTITKNSHQAHKHRLEGMPNMAHGGFPDVSNDKPCHYQSIFEERKDTPISSTQESQARGSVSATTEAPAPSPSASHRPNARRNVIPKNMERKYERVTNHLWSTSAASTRDRVLDSMKRPMVLPYKFDETFDPWASGGVDSNHNEVTKKDDEDRVEQTIEMVEKDKQEQPVEDKQKNVPAEESTTARSKYSDIPAALRRHFKKGYLDT